MRTVPKLPCVLMTMMIIILSSCNYTGAPQDEYFDAIAGNDAPLNEPQPGDWRHEHHEKQQSLSAYRRALFTARTDSNQALLLVPVGAFTPLQMQLFEDVRAYAAILFQRDARLLPTLNDNIIPESARRLREDGHEQLRASYIIDSLLPNLRPDSAFAVLAITSLDLYPQPDWNFVFGLANYDRHVGVSSIYRLQDELLQKQNYNSCLLRLNKIASHEVAHMLKLHHCLNAQCVMNGTNSLGETDRHPARACAVCQRKLDENLELDDLKRLKSMLAYFRKHNLTEEAARCQRDLD